LETILANLDTVLLCSMPPYLPNDYIGIVLEGDRIYLSFTEHFRRPVNLTFEETLSLNLALKRLPLARHGLEAAEQLQQKMLALLPSGAQSQWRAARRQLEAGPLPREIQNRIALLEQAI